VINGTRAIALEASKVLQELELGRHRIASPRTALACGRAHLAPGLVQEFSHLLGDARRGREI
jgi:hypothetical protein